jgi:hypothetical protein
MSVSITRTVHVAMPAAEYNALRPQGALKLVSTDGVVVEPAL